MDISARHNLDGVRGFISKRIQGLRANASRSKRLPKLSLKLDPRWKSGIFGIAFVAMAGFLAWGAQEMTYSHALQDWERRRLPSERIWAHALGSRGWNSPTAREVIHKAVRKLPAALDSPGSAWVSPDLGWIVVFSDLKGTVPEKLFCRDCGKPPESWQPAGIGWSAFDEVMERVERAGMVPPAPRKGRKVVKFIDPREIHY